MVDRTPHHHPALVALRRLERALCNEKEAYDEVLHSRAKIWGKINPTAKHIEAHKAAQDAHLAASNELRAARWAACDLLQREGITPETDHSRSTKEGTKP